MKSDLPGAADDRSKAPYPPRVRGEHVFLQPIEVTLPGGARFTIGVAGVPVQVDLPVRGAASAVVHVASPLAFDGLARVEDLPVQVARSAELANGRVRVTAGVRVRSAGTTAGGVIGDLEMAPGVVVREVLMADDQLTLDLAPRSPGIIAGGAGAWQPRGSSIQLYPVAGTGAPLTIEVSSSLALVLEAQGQERDGLLPVQARWSDGAALSGKVKRAELREIGPSETFAPAELDESPPGGVQSCGPRSTPRGGFRGVRRVSGGAVIYAEPGRGAWARVAAPADLEVEYAPGDRYAAIVKASGIVQLGAGCAELVHAWVDKHALASAPGGP